jgi:hypothetical protein
MRKVPPHFHKHLGFLNRLARFSAARPLEVLLVALLLTVSCLYYTVAHLDFETSRNDLVAKSERAVQRFSEISDDFGDMSNAIVVVEGGSLQERKAFILDLAERLREQPRYFKHLLYRIDASGLEGKQLLYLSPEEIRDLKDKLEDYGELIEDLAFSP